MDGGVEEEFNFSVWWFLSSFNGVDRCSFVRVIVFFRSLWFLEVNWLKGLRFRFGMVIYCYGLGMRCWFFEFLVLGIRGLVISWSILEKWWNFNVFDLIDGFIFWWIDIMVVLWFEVGSRV